MSNKIPYKEFLQLVAGIFEYENKPITENQLKMLPGIHSGHTYDDMKGYNAKEPDRKIDVSDINGTGATISNTICDGLIKLGVIPEGIKLKKKNIVPIFVAHKDKIIAALEKAKELNSPSDDESEHILVEQEYARLCEYLKEPGSLVRVTGGLRAGKTELLSRSIDALVQQDYKTYRVDLKSPEIKWNDVNAFMNSILCDVPDSLDSQLDKEKYEQALGEVDMTWTSFIRKNILSKIEHPLLLAIDGLEKSFKHPVVFKLFAPYLRAWHEKAKGSDPIGMQWKKLRIVIAYRDLLRPELSVATSSPFNVGEPLYLKDVDLDRVIALASSARYRLHEHLGDELKDWCGRLMKLVGGNRYLIVRAFDALKNNETNPEELLRLAPSEQGIYREFLPQLQHYILREDPKAESEYRRIISEKQPVKIDEDIKLTLFGLGLVKPSEDNRYYPSCYLYRLYFCRLWSIKNPLDESGNSIDSDG